MKTISLLDAQSFTALTDDKGAPLADSRFTQVLKNDILTLEARSDFPDGGVIVERASLKLHPQIVQESWSWSEKEKGGKLVREYSIDFKTKKAKADRYIDDKHWAEDLDIEPGKTFAGLGMIVIVKALRGQLKDGESIKLKAAAMTPKPRVAAITITRNGADTIEMAGRSLKGDRYTIHVDIPKIARLIIDPPDQHIWLNLQDPPSFLRFEGSLVEPKDPIIRIDLLAGKSANAQ